MATSVRIDELRNKFAENPRRYFAPLANEYRKMGDLDQAILICEEYLPQQPGHMSGHIVYGQTLYEAGRFDESRGVFETALSLDPENLIALRHLGDIARRQGDTATARSWYQRVLETDPRNDEIAALVADLENAPASQPSEAQPEASAGAAREMIAEAPTAPPVQSPPEAAAASVLEPVSDSPSELLARPSDEPPPIPVELESQPIAETPSYPSAPPEEPVAPSPEPAAIEVVAQVGQTRAVELTSVVAETSIEQGAPPEFAEQAPTSEEVERGSAPSPEPLELHEDVTGTDSRPEPAGVSEAWDPSFIEKERDYLLTPPMGEVRVESALDFATSERTPEAQTELEPEPRPAVLEAAAIPESARVDGGHGRQEPSTEPPSESSSESGDVFVTETMAELYLKQGHLESAAEIYRELVDLRPSDRTLRDRLSAVEHQLHAPPSIPHPVSEAAVAGGQSIREFLSALFARLPAPLPPASAANGGPPSPSANGSAPNASSPETSSQDASSPEASLFAPPVTERAHTETAGRLSTPLDLLFASAESSDADIAAATVLADAFADEKTAVPLDGLPARHASSELSLDHLFRSNTPARGVDTSAAGFSFDRFFAEDMAEPAASAGNEPAPQASGPTDDIAQFNTWLNGLKKT